MTEKRLAEYQRRILKECSTSASVGIVLRELIIEAQLEMAAQASPPTHTRCLRMLRAGTGSSNCLRSTGHDGPCSDDRCD